MPSKASDAAVENWGRNCSWPMNDGGSRWWQLYACVRGVSGRVASSAKREKQRNCLYRKLLAVAKRTQVPGLNYTLCTFSQI